MNTVNLRISGLQNASNVEVFVDGEAVAGKKNQFGSYEVRYQTEKQNVEIALRNNSELDGRFWWFFALISFLVSVFGIFNPRYAKAQFLDCRFDVDLKENSDIRFTVNKVSTGRAVETQTNCNIREIVNQSFENKKVKRRRTLLTVIKILSWIALAVVAAFVISKKL